MNTPLDSPTVATRAVTPTSPDPGPLPGALAEALASSPGLEPAAYPPEWATDRLSPLAAILHSGCSCDWGGDVEGHGIDFEAFADRVRTGILAESVDAKHPVEAKVWAGTWGTLGATVALALVSLLLARLDVIPSLLGGPSPWAGALVMVLSVAVPPVTQFIRSYLANHTARPADALPVPTEVDG